MSFTFPAKQLLQENWQLLTQRKVNFVRDKDEIVITNNTLLTGLRFSALERALGISEVKIYFTNGDKLEPSIDEIIKEGEQSSVIDLGQQGKTVSKIELKYRTIGSVLKGRGQIQVYGRTAAGAGQSSNSLN